MGMDVFGKSPDSKVGEYFRNNIWWWHPLWDYCCEVAPDITKSVDGHSNVGDGLGKRSSLALAKILRGNVASGAATKYEAKREAELSALPDEPCGVCAGTGKRLPVPNVGAGHIHCNGCDGKGKARAWETNYPFSVENVSEFTEFLEHCGGFRIC